MFYDSCALAFKCGNYVKTKIFIRVILEMWKILK